MKFPVAALFRAPVPARFLRLFLFLVVGLMFGGAALPAQAPAVGLHYGSDFSTTQYEDFGAWLGRKVMYRVTFLDKTSWSTIQDCPLIETSKKWVNSYPGRVEVISVPMFANGDTSGFSSITSGKRDGVFRAIAQKIQNAGIADKIIIRLAWEANGDWYNWSFLKNPSGFKSAYRHIVWQMKKVAPKLRFEFNISCLANRNGGAKWTEGYPGNDVIDVISMDIYDHWNPWSTMMAGDAGLAEMRDFAAKNNKFEAFAEWSCSTTPNGHGDNAGFIRAMASWMDARPGKVLYHSYWNTSDGAKGLVFSLVSAILVPQAAAEYKKEFGGGTSTAAAVAGNTAPKISAISDKTIGVNGTTGAISFTVSDAQTSASQLKIITNTSDQLLVPPSRVSVGGSGSNRTVTVTPVSNKSGWTTVWVKVSDGQLTSTVSFLVHVTATNLTFRNIGSNNVAGSHKENDPYVRMYARGYDIAGTADEFYFGEVPLQGDTELIVKVNSLDGPHAWSKAGLMFRGSTAADAAFVSVFVTPTKGVLLQWRSGNGLHAASSTPLARSAPRWLRLIRDGDAFHAFSSSDGENWEWVESVAVDLPGTARAGLAVVSHDPDAGATALFQSFRID
jgi:hypothetical protein